MLRQIKLLSGVSLRNICGLNEVRYGKDPAKRKRFIGMGILYVFLLLILWGYVGAFSFGMIAIGIGEVVPYCLYMIASLVILCFSFFKAANVIFQKNTYELMISLPVSRTAIVASRFLTMYATDLLISLAVMLPGAILYAVMRNPSVGFYVWGMIGTLLLPCLPLVIATAAGFVILAVSSGMRHKNLVSIGLSLLLVIAVLAGNLGLAGNPQVLEQMDVSAIRDAALFLNGEIQKVYPPAAWFGASVVDNDLTAAGLLIAVSLAGVFLLLLVLQRYFASICSALNTTTAKNNYRMRSLSKSGVVTALWKRELKRYFASSIYVTNTVVGYILMVMAAAALCITGADSFVEMLGLPPEINVYPVLPFGLAMIGNMMPVTASSVSMEGKQWWISQTLPVTMKQILDGKLLLSLSIAAPFYVAAELLSFWAVKPSLTEGIWLILVPLVYTVFLSVVGLSINLAFPLFQWESEVRVVKQSMASGLTLLVVFVSALVPCILLILPGAKKDIITAGTLIAVGIVTVLLYRRNRRVVL